MSLEERIKALELLFRVIAVEEKFEALKRPRAAPTTEEDTCNYGQHPVIAYVEHASSQ